MYVKRERFRGHAERGFIRVDSCPFVVKNPRMNIQVAATDEAMAKGA